MRRLCRRTPLFDRFLKLDHLVEQAPDRNLWTDAVTQIEQTFTELAFDQG